LPAGAAVIAADSGAELGGRIDLLVGDLDSISAETLAGIERVERHPAKKDATDLELALRAALRLEPERILVVGGAGGRPRMTGPARNGDDETQSGAGSRGSNRVNSRAKQLARGDAERGHRLERLAFGQREVAGDELAGP